MKQPENGIARSIEESEKIADRIGYPVVVRPSYVLGGRAMEIVYDIEQLRNYMKFAVEASPDIRSWSINSLKMRLKSMLTPWPTEPMLS